MSMRIVKRLSPISNKQEKWDVATEVSKIKSDKEKTGSGCMESMVDEGVLMWIVNATTYHVNSKLIVLHYCS